MTISNVNTKYLKVDSATIADIINNSYSTIDIIANLNCCKEDGVDKTYTDSLDISGGVYWKIDLSLPVAGGDNLLAINFFNSYNKVEYNSLATPINLVTVLTDCLAGSGCTLENSTTDYALQVKTAIDAWFLTLGITSAVVVSFTENVMKLEAIPSGFSPVSASYGEEDAPTIIVSAFLEEGTNSFLSGDSLYLKPELFEMEYIEDGVYSVTVKITHDDGHITESNCAFIDITIACQVADKLSDLIVESTKKTIEPVATIIHMLHYGITNGSNCGCNCADLCKAYKELICLIDTTQTTTSDCGC